MTRYECDICGEEIVGSIMQGLKVEPRGNKALRMLGETNHYSDLCEKCLKEKVATLKKEGLIVIK